MKLGCTYEGPGFGASYPDATCIDGYLWDLDSGTAPIGQLTNGGDKGCPHCNPRDFLEYYGFAPGGNSRQRRKAWRKKMRATAKEASQWV